MSTLRTVVAAFLLLSAPSLALAQPANVFVCTPDGQIISVNGTSGSVLFTGTVPFDDCVVGPDGRLYVSAGNQIERMNPSNAAGSAEFVATLNSAARGLAFNLDTLYINTASTGAWSLPGIAAANAPPYPAPVSVANAPAISTSGRGVAFDVPGDLVFASGSDLRSSSPSYTGNTILAAGVGSPRGVAVNTCGEVVFADKASQSVKRVSGGTVSTIAGLTFSKKEFPRALEIDSGNHIYLLTAEDDAGSNAVLYRADPPAGPLASSCASATLTPLITFKSALTGKAIAGLLSARALGVAIGPSDVTLSHTFDGVCEQVYDFGYHAVAVTFTPPPGASCPSGVTLDIKAHKARPGDVVFDPAVFAPATQPVPYSPLGGFATEYVLLPSSPDAPMPFKVKYGFFSQKPLATPGVARDPDDTIPDQAPGYDQKVGNDFWDVGTLDAATGETANDYSKRVVYTTPLVQTCHLDAAFDEPLNSGNPLFNGVQNLKIQIGVTDGNGQPCNGGTLRVSIVRILGSTYEPQNVTSDSQVANIMDQVGPGTYKYNLDLLNLDTAGATSANPAQFQITVWSDIAPSKNQSFRVTK